MPVAPTPELILRKVTRVLPAASPFEWCFALPHGIRRAAIDRLRLSPGDAVLDVGCGTGRNFGLLEGATGPAGRIHGIDAAEGALAQAHARSRRHQWMNILLTHGDAATSELPSQVCGAIFSLSYGVMARRRDVLARVWDSVRPGGRIVVMDAKTPPGPIAKLIGAGVPRPGAPGADDGNRSPWDDLTALGADVTMDEWALGTYFIAVGTKAR